MVFFNYATMQMAAKIVYYGPGLCGKTTNLHHIYAKTSPQSRGEMVSLETETDRTLFFDLLPIDVGVIGGFKTRLQLYTIPGQVFYNTTRKLVLKGVDGIVFVADSQKAMLDANLESFKNLRDNLAEIGVTVEDIPLVMQLNKRDLPNIADPDTILGVLDPERKYDYVEAVAYKGDGVFETLKLISKLTLRQLRRRMTGEEPASKPAVPKRDFGTFRVQANSQTAPAATIHAPAVTPILDEPIEELVASEMVETTPAPAEPAMDATLAKTADLDTHIISDAPVADVPTPAAPQQEPEPEPADVFAAGETLETPAPIEESAAAIEDPVAPEPEIDFSQTEKPTRAAPDVKHVKVRSSVDVMAELEALRKKATQTTPKPPKRDAFAELVASTKPKKDMHRNVALAVAPDVLPKTRRVRLAVSFESDEGVLQTQDHVIEIAEGTDVGSLSVNLKLE
jgi:signal recognition particle receptor subunit beta